MAALETRGDVAASGNCYLCPLSSVLVPPAELERLRRPVWDGRQCLTPVYRPRPEEGEEPEKIAQGFSDREMRHAKVDENTFEWQEQRLVVRSMKQAERQEKALNERLAKAQQAITDLNRHGRGRKRLDEAELRSAVGAVLDKYRVPGRLRVHYHRETKALHKRAYGKRPAHTLTQTAVTVHSALDPAAYQHAVRHLGWRV